MLEHYLATLFRLGQPRDLAHSPLPKAPVQPQGEGRRTDPNRRSQNPSSPTDTAQAAAPADPPVAAGEGTSLLVELPIDAGQSPDAN